MIKVGIAGLGKSVPEKVLGNHDLERMVDTSDEWIVQRTGIVERRIAEDDQWTSRMGTDAGRQALEDAGVAAADVDLVICCTCTGDMLFPATACEIANNLGATNAGGFDLSAACSGFVFGLQVGAQFVASGTHQNVLVVGAEKLSSIIDYEDRDTCVLFGDGAGAALLRPHDLAGRAEYLGGSIKAEGGNSDVLSVPAGGSRFPASHQTVDSRQHYMKMGGRRIFRFAVRTFAELVREAMEPYGYEQLGLVIPHQVNQRIIEAAAERLELPMDYFFVNIAKYGNTSAASVPLAMTEALEEGKLEPGKIVCTVAFGAGLTWGHALFRW